MPITFDIAAFEEAGGRAIEKIIFCQLSIVIGAELWNPARFSAIEYLIQPNATNHTATILTVLQSKKGWIGEYNWNESMHVSVATSIFRSKANQIIRWVWLSHTSRR